MKTYLVLFAVLFCLVFISFFGSSEENAVPVFNENSDELFYEIDLNDLYVTTKTLKNLNFKSIIRAYPKFSNIYEDRIEQKYYNFDTSLDTLENCTKMQERYMFLLNHYGLIHDKQEYQVTGIPISKIIIISTPTEITELKQEYSIKEVTV